MISAPRRAAVAVVAAALVLAIARAQESRPTTVPGPVVAIGGGKDVPAIVKKFVDLSGGADARILVLAINTSREHPGEGMVGVFRDNGAKNLGIWAPSRETVDTDSSLDALRAARGLYISGGDQTIGMKLLAGTKALGVIRERHRVGAVVGGSSAGCAILSATMIEGGKPDQPLTPGVVPTSEGLGISGPFILDQHFLARSRLQRLITVVLDHPGERGLGLDEKTAAVIFPDRIEIMGLSQAVLVDVVTKPESRPVDTRPLYRAPEVRLRVMLPGDVMPR